MEAKKVERKAAKKGNCWVDQKVVEMVVRTAEMRVEMSVVTRVGRSVSKLVDRLAVQLDTKMVG
jgi:hypothetical protein